MTNNRPVTEPAEIPEPELRRLRKALADEQEAVTERLNAVKAARNAGGSIRVIAKEARRSPTTIQKWVNS
ncbi:Uncharacterised protein [Mycobacteroides abscessus subsp. abscessus]|uniref:helix-turn-helix domain-containing protein n=1 Tax=Mycobacteroides abscessus TaxID=36809 RepID=UPI00092A39A8|nr:helix-turn-helix domain-containing protein [Mycobacteroides abscessus]SHX96777.1 Uncharacterised protein [Mycobacteroides abscessus subsp. abscessus]SIC77824.1 Uncharacterised protein [Mycobacteroides abscessus subsp. abscessus]SKP27770.1 Uncharacterised protein [Mycobacteroides abscessus subsp. abscessus]